MFCFSNSMSSGTSSRQPAHCISALFTRRYIAPIAMVTTAQCIQCLVTSTSVGWENTGCFSITFFFFLRKIKVHNARKMVFHALYLLSYTVILWNGLILTVGNARSCDAATHAGIYAHMAHTHHIRFQYLKDVIMVKLSLCSLKVFLSKQIL